MEIKDWDVSVIEFDKKFNGKLGDIIIEFRGFDHEVGESRRMRLLVASGDSCPVVLRNMQVEGVSIVDGTLLLETKCKSKLIEGVDLSLCKCKGHKIKVLREGMWVDFTTSRV